METKVIPKRNGRCFRAKDGYAFKEVLLFGAHHITSGLALFETNKSEHFDSAGYLVHLGIELLLKSVYLYQDGYFTDTHDVIEMYDNLSLNGRIARIDGRYEELLRQVGKMYNLRYPMPRNPIETGSDQLEDFVEMLDALWTSLPPDLIEACDARFPAEKGGRALMRKKESSSSD